MNISFKGMSRNGSERNVEDGNLAILINGTVRGGTIIGVQSPSELDVSIPTNGKLLFVHSTSDETKNYIYSVGTTLYNGTTSITDLSSTINSVNAIGNTLIALCDDGMHYFLWQDGAYNYIGQKPPEMNIQFGLSLFTAKSDEFKLNDDISTSDTNYSEEINTALSTQILGYANKLIASVHNEKFGFIYPFFIRYAYRLYDGSLYMHSAPILMIPNTKPTPVCSESSNGKIHNEDTYGRVYTTYGQVWYQVLSDLTKLSNWKDIIKKVDIYISAPIYTYDESGKIDFTDLQSDLGYSVGIKVSSQNNNQSFKEQNVTYPSSGRTNEYFYSLPHFTDREIADKVKNVSLFYLLRSLDVNELSNSMSSFEVKKNEIDNIATATQMTDDYQSHDNIIPEYSYSYNSRLNISGLKRSLFDGFDLAAQTTWNDTRTYDYSFNLVDGTNDTNKWISYVYIKENGKTYIVKSSASLNMTNCGFFFYYPNQNAYQVVFSKYDGTTTSYIKVNLTKHALLNGSYYFDSFSGLHIAYSCSQFLNLFFRG
jgi:hypothetical protein